MGTLVSASETRVRMLNAAVKSNPKFHVSLCEILKPDISYTYETLNDYYREHKESEIFFIMGMDSFKELPTWERYSEFFGMVNIIVCQRSGCEPSAVIDILPREVLMDLIDQKAGNFQHISGNWIFVHESQSFNISSTDIRQRVEFDRSIRYLVPDEVRSIIKETQLFQRG